MKEIPFSSYLFFLTIPLNLIFSVNILANDVNVYISGPVNSVCNADRFSQCIHQQGTTVTVTKTENQVPTEQSPSNKPESIGVAERSTFFNQNILNTADAVLAAFENQDGQVLADLAHPIKGVRFSPNTFIEISTDPVFPHAELAHIWSDFKTYYWGEEASGDDERHPINMNPGRYFYDFIVKPNFRYTAKVVLNETFTDGAYNTEMAESIMAKVYPHTEHADYYIKDSVREYLRLVFERMNGKPFLVGVIHSSAWTP